MGKIRPMRKSTRKINGDTYHLTGSAKPKNKTKAQEEANRIRNKGFPARVIRCKGGYRVFARHTFRKRKKKS